VKLVVGLGNPGPQYRDTRHNVGFWVIDEIARRWGVSDNGRERFDAWSVRATHAGESVLLAKPLTFMNASGQAVLDLLQFYKIELADLLVVVDDTNLALGRLRARGAGSAGGHNGLKSVIGVLGSGAFARLRIGVGRGDARRDLADHVLAKFEPQERLVVSEAIERATEAVELFVAEGIEPVMNRFNRALETEEKEEET